jgi:hypothetical protein
MKDFYLIDYLSYIEQDKKNDAEQIANNIHNILLCNNIDILTLESTQINIITKNYDLQNKINSNKNLEFLNYENFTDILAHIKENLKLSLIMSNVVGISKEDIEKYLMLMQYEEDLLLLGKTEDTVSIIMTNNYNPTLFNNISILPIQYDVILQNANLLNYKIEIVQNYFKFSNSEDILNLNQFLSNKESKKFCPDYIYDELTNLFIEYKKITL